MMAELRSRLLFRMEFEIGSAEDVGATPSGPLRVISIKGGTFEGPRVRGTILPGTADWARGRSDGSTLVDVRMTLRTDDAALIYMAYRGIFQAPADLVARLKRGESVSQSEYYMRGAPFFETGSAKYGWLNDIVAVAVGERTAAGATYDVYEIE